MIPTPARMLARWLARHVPETHSEAIAHDPQFQRLMRQFDDMLFVPVPVDPTRARAREQAVKAAGNAVAQYVQTLCKKRI